MTWLQKSLFLKFKEKKKKNLTDIVLSKLYGLSHVPSFEHSASRGKKLHALDTSLEVEATLRGLESSTVVIILSDAILL